jgi:hypothetical protein
MGFHHGFSIKACGFVASLTTGRWNLTKRFQLQTPLTLNGKSKATFFLTHIFV